MTVRSPNLRTSGLAALGILLWASPLAAQTSPKWEIEFHGGGNHAGNATDGNANLPAAGGSFTTVGGRPSRRTSSWYFGDGARLLNDVNTALPASGQVTPLDPVLTSASASRESGGIFGARLVRAITSRFKVEISVDYSRSSLGINQEVARAIQETRATFITAWNALLATGPFSSPNVTSSATIGEDNGHQVFTLGALNINLTRARRFTPYATVGGGLLSNVGDAPSVILSGQYRFRLGNDMPMTERDTVTLRYSGPDQVPVGVFGGGFTYDLWSRSGVRVDVRVHLSPNRVKTILSTHPEVVNQTPSGFIASDTTPSIQFSNTPALGFQSTLSGPDIAEFETFEGSGLNRHITMTAGWFWRF
jgi:hypothetical protein